MTHLAENHLEEPADAPAATDPSEAPGTTIPDQDATALKAERDDLYDRLLRKTAEFDNYRKRIERERREQADHAVVNLLQDLLQVVDDFDLAALTVGTDVTAGHQAVLHESSPEHRDGEVIGELRRGYMLGDRLLRPSMVKVAKA